MIGSAFQFLPVRPTTVPNRAVRCPRMSVCPLPLLRRWLCNVHRHKPERPSGTPCHTPRRNESRGIPSLLRVTPSATSEHLLRWLGSSPIPQSFVTYCVRLQLRPLSSTGITRLHRYYKPLRHPRRPGLSLASSQLIQLQSPLGLPVLPLVPFACMPSPLPRQLGRKLFARNLPPHRPSPSPRRVGTCIMIFEACSAFTHVTACTLAESSSRPFYIGGFSSFVASTAAPIATGWNEPVPGWDSHPLWTKRLCTAHADQPSSWQFFFPSRCQISCHGLQHSHTGQSVYTHPESSTRRLSRASDHQSQNRKKQHAVLQTCQFYPLNWLHWK
jgi:hypothetical protein